MKQAPHARPVSPAAGVFPDVSRDRSIERLKLADRAIAELHGRLRSTGADSDVVNNAFALVRDSLNEAREAVRETRKELGLVLYEWEQLNRRLRNPSRYPEAAAPVIPDPPGLNLCPDPGTAQTPAEFMETLRTYRKWAGKPSYRVMEHVTKNQYGQHFAASTIHAALKSDDLPTLQKVQAIIAACGGNDVHQQMFTTAWRRLTMSQQDDMQQPRRSLYPVSETALPGRAED
jgi:hypothetical protein